jgi:ABC-type branched-subunit amino acid transport system ATPase component/ABC-type branched-subunit amino acid transport system permease subunit
VRVGALVVIAGSFLVYDLGVVPGFRAPASALPQLCIAALMALAVWLPFASGQLSLAQAGFMALGAYGSAWLTVHASFPFGAALAVAALGTAALGLAASYPALRLRGIYLAIATLGLGEVIRVIFLNLEATGGAFGFSGIARRTEVWHLVLALAVTCGLLYRWMQGRTGRAIAAVRADSTVAAAFGIEITRVRMLTFTLGALLAGLAGGFQAHYVRFISPENYDLAALIEWITMMILGGFQTFVGVLAGALVVGSLPDMLHFAADWRLTINAILLMVLVVLRPQGLVPASWVHRTRTVPRDIDRPAAGDERAYRVASEETTPLLVLEDVSKAFGGVMALDAVSLSVQRHAIHAIIGPNGAGKTTLFNVVTGFYTADRGIVRFDGAAIGRLSPFAIARLGAARTFQNLRLIGDMPALDNVLIGAHRRMHCGPAGAALGLDRGEERHARRDALELLARFGLAQRAAEPARALPYGDQRRLEIARALASAPKLLLLDEPAAGMNRPEAEALAVLIRDIRREFGVTIVLIEHDMNFVMSLCDHVSVLDFGRVIASGEPQAVQRDEAVARAYLGAATQTPGDRAWIS